MESGTKCIRWEDCRLMVNYEKAKNIVLLNYSDSIIMLAFDTNTKFIFSIRPEGFNIDDELLDPFFSVTKDTGILAEYSPLMDIEEFKNAVINRVIYKIKETN